MKKSYIGIVVVCIVLVGMFIVIQLYMPRSQKAPNGNQNKVTEVQYKDATYVIDSMPVTLINGSAVSNPIPGSASILTTRYFGNEARGDINGDDKEDVVFLLTQDNGGSGTFYYVTAALQGEHGYTGINAVLLGDRIAPQTTEIRDQDVIVNYADRKPGEPMTANPSQGISKYFRVVNDVLTEKSTPTTHRSGVLTEQEARVIAEKTCIKGGEALSAGTYNDNSKTWWFDANLNATKPGCNPACVVSESTGIAEINWRCMGLLPS